MERYVNDIVASEVIGLAPQTLRNYRHRGVGPSFCKVGKAVRYKIEDLYLFMESRKVETGDI